MKVFLDVNSMFKEGIRAFSQITMYKKVAFKIQFSMTV